jgi:acetyl-CoA carboxylase biotin carboxylase subunit
MGDKALARKTMRELGLDPIPGSREPTGTIEEASRVAEQVGYPVLLKAVAGGGGRGMRGVDTPGELAAAFEQASAEARSSFGDGRLYLERRILGGRHVEVQVIADGYGGVLVLGERECSIQRRHQKVVEEGPSPGLPDAERDRILPLVADVIRRSGYRNAGTVEMLLDAEGNAWFMEMNTRLQVEHGVSELVTGLDLVELQLRVAANEPLPLTQADVTVTGHAIECRINAEDPDDDFRPSPGTVTRLQFPEGEGIRVDTHLSSGDRIPPNYDSMVAKLLVHADTREAAIERMEAALADTVVDGVRNNLELHKRILAWEAFRSGQYDTRSLETDLMGA